jgi:5-methylcytosine-specific restriction protein A
MGLAMAWSHTSRHERGYGAAWDKLRARILTRDKHLCQACKRKGRLTAANQVDHIKPKAKGGTDDEQNLQSLCKPCHDAKSVVDAGGRARVEIGADGWPVEYSDRGR